MRRELGGCLCSNGRGKSPEERERRKWEWVSLNTDKEVRSRTTRGWTVGFYRLQ